MVRHNQVHKINGEYYIDKRMLVKTNKFHTITKHYYLMKISRFRYLVNKIINIFIK